MSEIKVLVVDDSVLFRETITRKLSQKANISIVGKAFNATLAKEKILSLKPDVVTLDIEMPGMNGIDFLKQLIPENPVPVVVVTSSPVNAFEAISAGAVEFIKKPIVNSPRDMEDFIDELHGKIAIAKLSKVKRLIKKPAVKPVTFARTNLLKCSNTIIALGASTGGTNALQYVLERMPENCPPIVIVQHMPAVFTKMYAERINSLCKIKVKEAEDGDRLECGLAIIAAGEYHLRLEKDSRGYYVSSKRGEKVSGHCPSVDVLFESVAKIAGKNSIGAIMTGMGSDGAKGLLQMKKAGAYTIGQDKESSVVYGMPMVAFNIGAVIKQTSLEQIPQEILENIKK
ncbi:MAG: chemotaxis response regulator protein-glutamate methylesterase [Clostridiales bacterium]|nr:chemotaxis response regulator protein-glutamate methylesterase [Clostridiales bacterium]